MKSAPYRAQFAAYVLAMMADNIEHVISYWVAFQKFQSPALGGFAVVSHWLPFLLFSVRRARSPTASTRSRLIQIGMALFMFASVGWAYFFSPTRLQMWHAMVLLVVHGCAGVLWSAPSQVLLHDIVGAGAPAERGAPMATARYLGLLVGPGVGGVSC